MENNEKANKRIFISHASANDKFVKDLRIKLELHGLTVWVDSRNLRGGDKLEPVIEQVLHDAGHVIAVLSPKTITPHGYAKKSTWPKRLPQSGRTIESFR